jgi:hypothetical protein
MNAPTNTPPQLRALLTEAAELRRRGDLAAAAYLEADALRTLAAERREVAQ